MRLKPIVKDKRSLSLFFASAKRRGDHCQWQWWVVQKRSFPETIHYSLYFARNKNTAPCHNKGTVKIRIENAELKGLRHNYINAGKTRNTFTKSSTAHFRAPKFCILHSAFCILFPSLVFRRFLSFSSGTFCKFIIQYILKIINEYLMNTREKYNQIKNARCKTQIVGSATRF